MKGVNLLVFYIITIAAAEENHDMLLCRYCGHDIAESQYLDNVKSPYALGFRNDSVAGVPNVLVQLMQTTDGELYEIVTTLHADALVIGDWSEENSWYPEYNYKIGMCPQCGEQLGWVFNKMEDYYDANDDGIDLFMALLTHRVISRDLAESLLVKPSLHRA